MKIELTEFGGMAPMIEPRRLADRLSALAINTGFESGALAPVNIGCVASTEFPFQSAEVQSVLRPGADATRLMLTSGTTGAAFASLMRPNDKWGRVYFTTVAGPRFTVSDNYLADGVTLNPTSYKLGIPGPKYQITVGTPVVTEEEGVTADNVKVAYICTFVDSFGHESVPSVPSTIVDIPTNLVFTVDLTFVAENLPDTHVGDAKRYIYRAAFDGSTSAWQYVGEVGLAATSWTDTVAFGAEAEELVSTDWSPPPALKQMVPVASGFVAGFHAHYLCYSETYLPHAWPEAYRFPLKFPIVGLKPTSNGLLVATTGKPYWAFGADPASAVPVEIDANYPCLSANSLVDMGGYVMYATHDGLVAVSGNEARIVSDQYIDRFTWLRDFAPAQTVAFAFEGNYIFSVGADWWLFNPNENGGFCRLASDVMPVAPTALRQAYYDALRDTTVLLDTSGRCFDVVSQQGTTFVRRSRTFETPPASFGVGRVLSTAYPVQMRVQSGPVETLYTVADERPFRLAGGNRYTTWAIELEGSGRITAAGIAQSPQEFI